MRAKGPVKLCMLSGSFEYDSERTLGLFRDHLARRKDVETTPVVYRTEEDTPSLEPIDHCDVLLVFTRRLFTTGPELERFQRYCARGVAIVSIRSASHAFQNWLAFDKEVLGGSYDGHYGAGPECTVTIDPHDRSHPLVQGVANFVSTSHLYKNTPIAADAFLVMTGQAAGHTEPVTWTRIHKGGRASYTSLGNQKDFLNPSFLRLLENAVFWAAGRG